MKRNLLLFLLLTITVCVFAQKPDTNVKKDTVVVIKMEKTDTIAVSTLFYFGKNNTLKYDTTGGYVVMKGIAIKLPNNSWMWSPDPAEQPKPIAFLRKNKTPLKYKIWNVN